MEKIHFKLKTFEDFSQLAYDVPEVQQEPKKEEPKVEKEIDNTAAVDKSEEEESTGSLSKSLEKCIENVEEIVSMFEKNDQKLIDLVLPILDLCQTNLNFQEKKSPGTAPLLETSKKIIKELVEKLKKEYPNNDPVTELIENCGKL